MLSELRFLLTLLLDHELQKVTQDLIRDRIKQMEESLEIQHIQPIQQQRAPRIPLPQAPSILAKYPDLGRSPIPFQEEPLPVPTEQIAQTPETSKALADRQAMVSSALSKGTEPGRTAPRKIGRQ